MRFSPSNSSNLTGGGGSIGTRRMTEDSTCGGGLKSFRDTLIILSTLAYNYMIRISSVSQVGGGAKKI